MLFVVLSLSLGVGASTATPKKPRLAVLEIQNLNGVSAGLAQGMTAALVVAVRQQANEYSVISTDEIKAMLAAERQKAQLGCVDASCLAEIGGALGAARMITGQLGKFGNTYLLTVKLVDVRQAAVLKEAAENLKGVQEDALLDAVKRVTVRLFPNARSAPVEPEASGGDLWAENAPPPQVSHDHTLGWTLIGVAVASAGASIAGFVLVSIFNNNVNTWNAAVKSGSPAGETAAAMASDRNTASAELALGYIGAGLATAATGTAVLTW